MHIEVSESLIELQAAVAFQAECADNYSSNWYRDVENYTRGIDKPDTLAFWLLEAADRKERDAANERSKGERQ